MNYLAVGPYCWGKGTTREAAVKNAKRNWIKSYTGIAKPKDEHFSLYTSEGDFSVDALGGVESTKPIEKIQTSTLAS